MNDRDLINAASGYIAGNAVSNSVIYELKKYNEEAARKLAHITTEEVLSAEVAKFILSDNKEGAFEYLNSHFNEEIIDAAQNQKEYVYSLETIIKKRIDKYMPFYKRIGMDMPKQLEIITAVSEGRIRNLRMDMPKQLEIITADKLCEILGVTNLHIPDRADDKSSTSKSDSGSIWILCFVFFIIILITFVIIIVSL